MLVKYCILRVSIHISIMNDLRSPAMKKKKQPTFIIIVCPACGICVRSFFHRMHTSQTMHCGRYNTWLPPKSLKQPFCCPISLFMLSLMINVCCATRCIVLYVKLYNREFGLWGHKSLSFITAWPLSSYVILGNLCSLSGFLFVK